ncbi:unnamed protein product [Adineta steineri]|uniref:Delta(24)-sterol reductase n=1 Tax=Adineta steineri TaxID=433720 RepID=A0A815SKG7_9BILA|nr:unnamed protein product [Adineta steineri]CAF1493111.1 unnamed protein product [Adineta steineri]
MEKDSQLYELFLTIKWAINVYILWLYHSILIMMKVPSRKTQIDVEYLTQSIRECPQGSQIKIQRHERNSPSNSIRSSSSSSKTNKNTSIHFLHIGIANQILSIDKSSRTVTCEPDVTMEELVDALMSYDLVPTVVPEFKSLTIGGILAGAGLESSSSHYGQFADSLIEATYILSNGQIITCSPTKDSDLFYGALGSCGTFGLLIRATLRVSDIPSDCFVRCNYHYTNQPIESILSFDNNEDYIDAIVFSNYTVMITGQRIDKLSIPKTGRIQRFSQPWSPWYYQHVKKICNKTILCEYIPLKDYLFRYDRGAFWMGRYPINPLQDKIQHLPLLIRNFLNLFPFGGYNIISRTILSPLFTTSSLYRRLHSSSTSMITDTLLIQDIYIPISKSKQFLSFLQSGQMFMKDDEILEPIWLCPIRSNSMPQKMSPHYLESDQDHLFINFGLWTHQHSWQPGSSSGKNATKILEKEAKRLGGRKMLYSLSFYSKEEWSTIYDMQWYRQMKNKWDPDYIWQDLYDKVVQKSI